MKTKLILIFLFISRLLFSQDYGDLELPMDSLFYVIDGDTFKVNIPDYPPIIGENISIRLRGIDAPPVATTDLRIKELGIKSKMFLESILDGSEKIILRNMGRDKYFRILADVFVLKNGEIVDVGESLIDSGDAKYWPGVGSRPEW